VLRASWAVLEGKKLFALLYVEETVESIRDEVVKYDICQLYLYFYLLVLVVEPLLVIF